MHLAKIKIFYLCIVDDLNLRLIINTLTSACHGANNEKINDN